MEAVWRRVPAQPHGRRGATSALSPARSREVATATQLAGGVAGAGVTPRRDPSRGALGWALRARASLAGREMALSPLHMPYF